MSRTRCVRGTTSHGKSVAMLVGDPPPAGHVLLPLSTAQGSRSSFPFGSRKTWVGMSLMSYCCCTEGRQDCGRLLQPRQGQAVHAVGGYNRFLNDQRLVPAMGTNEPGAFIDDIVNRRPGCNHRSSPDGQISNRIRSAELLSRSAWHRLDQFEVGSSFVQKLLRRRKRRGAIPVMPKRDGPRPILNETTDGGCGNCAGAIVRAHSTPDPRQPLPKVVSVRGSTIKAGASPGSSQAVITSWAALLRRCPSD